jgi:uncharacterized protein YbjT (DUF2867 family)
MATLLVIGASRGIGLETVRRALAAGHRVRALARGAAAIDLHQPGLEKVAADALDATAVTRAIEGADAVVQSLGAGEKAAPQVILTGTTIFRRHTRILIDAMRQPASAASSRLPGWARATAAGAAAFSTMR